MDFDYAYNVHSAKIIRLYVIFEHYIKFARKRLEDDEIYRELQKVHGKFLDRHQETKDARNKTIKDLD